MHTQSQSQTLDVLFSSDILPDLDKFLSSLSILCTYHANFKSTHGNNTYPLLPTFFDLVDSTVDTSIDSLLTSTIEVYSQLNMALIELYKSTLDSPISPPAKSLLFQTLFQQTLSWINLSINTLIITVAQINFSSFLLLNTHETIGLNQVHLITITDLSQKTLLKLQTSTRFLAPPTLWIHVLSLISTFFEYHFVHFPLFMQNVFNLPYNAQLLQHLWVLPYNISSSQQNDSNNNQSSQQNNATFIDVSIEQYQKYTFSLLLSQPCLLQHPNLSNIIKNLQHTHTIRELNANQHETIQKTTSVTSFIPIYVLLTLLLSPLVIYSSPELLYIQSLRQAYILGTDSNLQILQNFEKKTENFEKSSLSGPNSNETKTYHHTLYLESASPTGANCSLDNIDILSSPQMSSARLLTSHPSTSSSPDSDFTQHSEITKLSLFYNNNAHLQRLLIEIYDLDLAQQEKYFNICQLRTKIDNQLHLIISRLTMLIYNHLFLRLQLTFHQVTPFSSTFIPSLFHSTFQELTEYQHLYTTQQQQLISQPSTNNYNNNNELLKPTSESPLTYSSTQLLFCPLWDHEQYRQFNAFSCTHILALLPTLIMFSHHQTYNISRPIKRITYILQLFLQSGYIGQPQQTITTSTTTSKNSFSASSTTTPSSSPQTTTTPSLSMLQSLLIDTMASIDYVSSHLLSPIPIKNAPPSTISTISQAYTSHSPLLPLVIR